MKKFQKSRIEVILLWWIIYFVTFAIVLQGTGKIDETKTIPILAVLLFVSLAVSVVMYFVGLYFFMNSKKVKIQREVEKKGITLELVAQYEKEMKKSKYGLDFIILADLYLSTFQYEQAAEALEKVRIQSVIANAFATSVRMEIVRYYYVLINYYVQIKDMENMQSAYREAGKYFDEFEKEYPHGNLVALARSNYFHVIGDFEKSLSCLNMVQIEEEEGKRLFWLETNAMYIKNYSSMGNTDEAKKLFEETLPYVKGNYEKAFLEQSLALGM